MTPLEQQKLEGLVRDAVRDLPPRRAPASLEERVNAEILRRASLPWWRRSYRNWPVSARIGFVAVCAAIVRALFVASGWIRDGFAGQNNAGFQPELESLRVCGRLFATALDVAGTLVSSLPALWLYGGAAFVIALYLTLVGLGAAAYRTLYASS